MPGDVAWLVLLAGSLGWEVASVASRGRWASLGDVVARLCGTRTGRLVVLGCWTFVGVHLFVRATLAGR